MAYTNQDILDLVNDKEVMLVFESGQEYEAHGDNISEDGDHLVLSGYYKEENEWRNVHFKGEMVEYYYTHDML